MGFLKNKFWSHLITIFLFTSPVLVYYSNNFLTNVPALSFVFLGWNLLLKYFDSGKNRYLLYSIILLCIAALLKMTAAISLIALFGMIMLEWIGTHYTLVSLVLQLSHSHY